MVFSGDAIQVHSLFSIIKETAWQWSAAHTQVLDKWFNLWNISPCQAYERSKSDGRASLVNKWLESNQYIGFVDGAWKQSKEGIVKAGICGFLLNSEGHVNFIFSGPCISDSPYLVEEHALRFMLENIMAKDIKEAMIVIATDSLQLAIFVRHNISNLLNKHSLLMLLRQLPNLKLVHINRLFNSEADRLAGEGIIRNTLAAGWV